MNNNRNIIYFAILEFISKNYGIKEAEEPCYNMEKMTDFILLKLKENEDDK